MKIMSFLQVQMKLGEMQMLILVKNHKEHNSMQKFFCKQEVLNFILSFLSIYEEIPFQDNFPSMA